VYLLNQKLTSMNKRVIYSLTKQLSKDTSTTVAKQTESLTYQSSRQMLPFCLADP
jgi:hypothetical protein